MVGLFTRAEFQCQTGITRQGAPWVQDGVCLSSGWFHQSRHLAGALLLSPSIVDSALSVEPMQLGKRVGVRCRDVASDPVTH